MKIRGVKRIVKGYPTMDGAGVKLIRVLGPNEIRDIDPFLMMDHFGSDNPEDYLAGFPMHPHRGIETITYLLDGVVTHTDSLGNQDSILKGELQWMTAGRGILHEEMPQRSDRLSGLQFWLNLPAKDKMAPPNYFPITKEMIKDIPIEGGHIKLISGEYNGEHGVKPLYVQATMMDITLVANQSFSMPIHEDWNSLVYLIEGSAQFGDHFPTEVEAHSAAIFLDGDGILAESGSQGVRFILLAGQPLNEPVAWGGPIVMNTEDELHQAFAELREGTFIK